jgi:hypothetical protein
MTRVPVATPTSLPTTSPTAPPPSPSPSPAGGSNRASPVASATPDPQADAVQTLLDYFTAIDQQQYDRAYRLWARNGAASGQSADSFAAGYANTVRVSVRVGAVSPSADGSSVSIAASLASIVNAGSQPQQVRRYQGTYVLARQSASAGASWAIVSASVSLVAPGTPVPDVADPVGLLRAYADAINQKAYARAYTDWDNFGQASQQSYADFARGFVTADRVALDLGNPTGEGAAGNLYATVPAVLVAAQTDGSSESFCGTYTLHRANVPPFDQLGWRIYRATILPAGNVQMGSAEEQHLLATCPAAVDPNFAALSAAASGTAVPSTVAFCASSNLAATAGVQGATGSLAGSVVVTNRGSTACQLAGIPLVHLVDASGQSLAVQQVVPADLKPASPVVVQPGQTAAALVVWRNWCGPAPAEPIRIALALPDGGQVSATLDRPRPYLPRCDAPQSGSQLAVYPFAPGTAP